MRRMAFRARMPLKGSVLEPFWANQSRPGPGFFAKLGSAAIAWERVLKLAGIALVVLVMAGLIIWLDYRQRQRGMPVELGGPGSEPPSAEPEGSDDQAPGTEERPEQSRRLKGERESVVEISEASSS